MPKEYSKMKKKMGKGMSKKDQKLATDKEVEEIEPGTDQKEDKDKPVSPADYINLATQCRNEYETAWKHQLPEKEEARRRLKVFNNQRRDKKAVGDTTMFSVFWTVLAGLYDDRLMSEFNAREEGDEETAANLNSMAEFDYDEMMKDKIDFDWDWDAAFFGRGFVEMEEYHRDPDTNQFYPMPCVLDPLTLLRDTNATSVNGRDRKRTGAAMFLGYEAGMTEYQLKENESIFASVKEGDMSELASESTTKSLLADAKQARNDAQNFSDVQKDLNLGDNQQYQITVWYTHYMMGGKLRKVKVWLANERAKVIGLKVIGDERSNWTIVDRPLYPHSHDWRGTSIPDLTEDKQRARAVALNLGLDIMKSDLNPTYAFDSNKIINRKDLNNKFNKYIPINAKGENINTAIAPISKANPNLGLINFIFESLDMSAQKATATPDIQQGIQSKQDRPLGETNIVAARTDTRYSLSAKIFGWSEKDFWIAWYLMYKEYFADGIDEKIVRIIGAFGAKWRPLYKNEMICRIDPDVSIESKNVSRAKQIDERRGFAEFLTLVFADPTANKRYGLKKLGRLYGLQKDEIDRLLPMTIDERMAEQENEKLSKDQFVEVNVEDDHNVHLEILAKAKETPATKAHRIMHEQALLVKKTRPELFPQDQNSQIDQTGGQQPPQNQMTTPPSKAPGGM